MPPAVEVEVLPVHRVRLCVSLHRVEKPGNRYQSHHRSVKEHRIIVGKQTSYNGKIHMLH